MSKRFSKKRAKEIFQRGLKHCAKCHKIKAHNKFHKNSKTWDKLKVVCKDCRRYWHSDNLNE